VTEIAQQLTALGLQPVRLGSRRVTRDFDFVIEQPGERLASAV
jgi:hypothetical protein